MNVNVNKNMIKNILAIKYTIVKIQKNTTDYKKYGIFEKIINDLLYIKKQMENKSQKYIFSSVEYTDNYNCCDDLIIYEKFAEGDTRDVFACNYNDIIIKKDKYSFIKSCFLEFIFWIIIKNTPNNKFFVPCVAISKNFNDLIMLKINKSNDNYINTEDHKKIKNFCDLIGYTEINSITRNYGVLNDKLCICDYSMNFNYNENFFNILIEDYN
jgi:hypothetical protein